MAMRRKSRTGPKITFAPLIPATKIEANCEVRILGQRRNTVGTRIVQGTRKRDSSDVRCQRGERMSYSNSVTPEFTDPCSDRVSSVAQDRLILIRMSRAVESARRGSSSYFA